MTTTPETWFDGFTGRRQQVSLRARVTMLAAISVAGAVALVSLGAYVTVRNSLYAQVATNLAGRAAQVASHRPYNDQVVVPRDSGLTDIQIDVVDSAGKSLVDGATLQAQVTEEERAVAAGRKPSSARVDSRTGTEVVSVPYLGLRPGTALVLAQKLDNTRATLDNLNIVLVVIGGMGILVAALAGTAVARAGLRPVQRLTEATERVATRGDLTPIPVTGDDELTRLTQSFNSMLGAVAESQERQRRLVADAGHELRTPLTSLRTNLELLLASENPNAPDLSTQDRADIHDDVRAQIDELTTLIGDLVELAREDAPQMVHEPVDLVEVVERALDRAMRRTDSVHFGVRLRPWYLLGDSNALERAVLNLLDNAVKWSPPGGAVRVDLLAVDDRTAQIEVADMGPGIAEPDLPLVFERFYRSSEARTQPGSGLGLAIVKQVAERHGGTAHAGRAPEGGALMTLTLPGRPH